MRSDASVTPRPRSFATPAAWRSWLRMHHAQSQGIWLKLAKAYVGHPLSYPRAVEEALCFGWIDGQLRRIDDRWHMLRFTPRRPGSVWAPSNIARMKRLIKEKRMTPAGLKVFRQADLKTDTAPSPAMTSSLRIPPDLARAFAARPIARQHFRGYPPSHQRRILWWVRDAKQPETRARRIRDVVKNAAVHARPSF